MLKNSKKVLLIILVTITTLGLLFGVNFLYKQQFVNQPLSLTLDNSEIITKYEIIDTNHNPVLKLKLAKTDYLAKEFQNLLSQSGDIFTKKSLTIEIYSNPNQRLLNFYQKVHPAIYEALAIGNYSNLQSKLQKEASEFDLTSFSLTITSDYLYLQLEDHENYLSHVFNRKDNGVPKVINNLGSDFE